MQMQLASLQSRVYELRDVPCCRDAISTLKTGAIDALADPGGILGTRVHDHMLNRLATAVRDFNACISAFRFIDILAFWLLMFLLLRSWAVIARGDRRFVGAGNTLHRATLLLQHWKALMGTAKPLCLRS
eukprot:GHVU01003586.1.p3 GENE.GHVU01003586.1~~GHVU01003586.1.p3  ORF type:complete len:130 (+),score=7.97 GHVU01003586.1:1465-1854(+)